MEGLKGLLKGFWLRNGFVIGAIAMASTAYAAARVLTPEIQGNTAMMYNGLDRIEYTRDCDGDSLVVTNPFIGNSRTTDNNNDGVPDEYSNGIRTYRRGDSDAGTLFDERVDKLWDRYRKELNIDDKLPLFKCD
ncbi:MAG: hypothetical protein V1729_02980 [Candidatus Woesearchaeota archaeon]